MSTWMAVWGIVGIVFLALAVAGAVSAVHQLSKGARRWALEQPPGDGPLELLRHRYAAGEIDEDEYLRRLSGLSQR